MNATASRNWLLNGSSGKKIRYLEVVKFYQFASKYTLMTLLGAFSDYITVSDGLKTVTNQPAPCSLPQP